MPANGANGQKKMQMERIYTKMTLSLALVGNHCIKHGDMQCSKVTGFVSVWTLPVPPCLLGFSPASLASRHGPRPARQANWQL